jgi:hypothetical protein
MAKVMDWLPVVVVAPVMWATPLAGASSVTRITAWRPTLGWAQTPCPFSMA